MQKERKMCLKLCLSILFLAMLISPATAGNYLIIPSLGDYGLRGSTAATLGEAGIGEDRIEQSFPFLNTVNTDLDEAEAEKLREERPDLLIVDADFTLHHSAEPGFLPELAPSSTPWHVLRALPLQEYARDAGADTSSVIIFVIDTGVDADHPDLRDRLEMPYAKRFHYVSGKGIISDDIIEDQNGHGSEVTGTVIGTYTGVAPALKVVPIRAASDSGNLSLSRLTAACDYIVGLKKGVLADKRIIVNLSYNSDIFSTSQRAIAAFFQSILTTFRENDILFVSPAGNNGADVDSKYVYPTRNEYDNYVAAASTGSNGSLSGFSNYGSLSVEVAAPGSAIRTTSNTGSYVTVDGTSFASPFTAGIAGLIWAIEPSLKCWEVRNLLINAVSGRTVSSWGFINDYCGTDSDFTGLIGSVRAASYGDGNINVIAGRALFPQIITGPGAPPKPADGEGHVPFDASLEWANESGGASFDIYFGNSAATLNAVSAGYTETSMDLAAVESALGMKLAYNTDYYWKVVTNSGGTASEGSTFRFRTIAPAAYDNSPVNSAVNIGLKPALSWSYDIDGSTFNVYLSTDRNAVAGMDTSVLIASGIGTHFISIPGTLNRNTTYYWMVVTNFTDADGRFASSAASVGHIQDFTTGGGTDNTDLSGSGGGGCDTGFLPGCVLLLAPLMFVVNGKRG